MMLRVETKGHAPPLRYFSERLRRRRRLADLRYSLTAAAGRAIHTKHESHHGYLHVLPQDAPGDV